MLPKIAWSFIARMCASVMMSLLPVAVMTLSASPMASSTLRTSKPSISACSALIGSFSVTATRAPWPASDSAQPLPTSPYPQISTFLPPISTSVPRLMPSISECRVPYLLSNLLLVTESLTLIAGTGNSPAASNWYSRSTPVVVSSVTPFTDSAIIVHLVLSVSKRSRTRFRNTFHSAESSSSAGGTTPAFSYCAPRSTSMVASPPSSRIMLADSPGQVNICSAAHQYSSSDSPFHANTGVPLGSSAVPCCPTTTAAAAWSWVEKMLQDAHRTSAPRATSVSMSTAVCTVMCSEPEIRAPLSGSTSAFSRRSAISPGISCSASRISLRPNSASDRSATLKSMPLRTSAVIRCSVVVIYGFLLMRASIYLALLPTY